MFDITIPMMADENCGASQIIFGEDYEAFSIYKSEDVKIADFVRIWQAEASSISRGRRKRGILPRSIVRDRAGRLGCSACWALFREKDLVHVHDLGIGYLGDVETFGTSSGNWWRCLSKSYGKWTGLKTISVESLQEFSERQQNLLHAFDLAADEVVYNQEIKNGNSVLLDGVLKCLSGGSDLYARFPSDYMEHIGLITRHRGRNREIQVSEGAATYQFDGLKIFPHRDIEELAWWVRMAFQHNDVVVFLSSKGNTGTRVPVFVLKPDDNIADVLPVVLEKTRIDNEGVDYVAFCARSELPEVLCNKGHVVLTMAKYRMLLEGVNRVLLGVCKGSAWAEFPLGKACCHELEQR